MRVTGVFENGRHSFQILQRISKISTRCRVKKSNVNLRVFLKNPTQAASADAS
jgi:hypothetical protein